MGVRPDPYPFLLANMVPRLTSAATAVCLKLLMLFDPAVPSREPRLVLLGVTSCARLDERA